MLTRAEATRRAEVSTICSSQQDCKQDFQWPTTRTPPSSIRRRLQITQKASRDVNVYIATGPINANSSLTINQYWDIASGVLTQLAFSATQKSGSSGQYTTTWSDLLIISETNIWSPSTFGFAQILFYGLLGAICLTAAIAAVIVATRKRKSDREPKILGSSQGGGPPNLSQMPVCRNCNGYNLPGTLTCRHCGAKLS